ncbi:MAG: glycoside hydrolase family 18 protein, partial [Verrucomicrobiae bacterium]|nr:glycoside hydrolase family 18 protein [Verrucomicrobiae bacterium]
MRSTSETGLDAGAAALVGAAGGAVVPGAGIAGFGAGSADLGPGADSGLEATGGAEDGSGDFSRITPELLAFGEKARAGGAVRVSVCVGGWGRGKVFASAVSSEASRSRFVQDLAAFCAGHQLGGVDIDWEFPKGDQEHAHFAAFLAKLGSRLHADGRLLTVALGYTRPLPAECWAHLDRVHLMSYQPWS